MIDLVIALLAAAPDAGQASSAISGADFFYVLRVLASGISLIIGLLFIFAGTFGVLRLPDFYTRLHAAGMTDTLGAELIILGVIIQAGFTQASLKLFLVGFFLFLTSPTATHAVANAAYDVGLKPLLGPLRAPSLEELEAEAEKERSA